MKICILSSFEDSIQKDSGASVRIYNLAIGLAAIGHNVKVIIPKYRASCEILDGVSVYGFRGLWPKAALKVLKRFVNVGRSSALYFYDFIFALRVSHLVREADVVQIEHQSSGGLLIPFIKKILKKPVVVDCHDVFQALRIKHTSMFRRMLEAFLEKLAYKNADLLLTVSEIEKERLISSGFQRCTIEVIPNGVDTKFFEKSFEHTEIREKYGLSGFQIVVFVGNLEYFPNREAIQLLSSVIAPKVSDKIKDVKFLVVGKLRNKIDLPRLTFTGFVDKVSDILSVSDVAVAPLFQGSGTRLKILEYLSCSVPVVTTSVGVEGLNVANGVNVLIEDDMDKFSTRIIELLQDEKLRRTIGDAGRELVVDEYDWLNIARRLDAAYRALTGNQANTKRCAV